MHDTGSQTLLPVGIFANTKRPVVFMCLMQQIQQRRAGDWPSSLMIAFSLLRGGSFIYPNRWERMDFLVGGHDQYLPQYRSRVDGAKCGWLRLICSGRQVQYYVDKLQT